MKSVYNGWCVYRLHSSPSPTIVAVTVLQLMMFIVWMYLCCVFVVTDVAVTG